MDVERHDGTHDTRFYDNLKDLQGDFVKAVADPTVKQIRVLPKVRRNDPCPCGSGKKAKKCCWNKRLAALGGMGDEETVELWQSG